MRVSRLLIFTLAMTACTSKLNVASSDRTAADCETSISSATDCSESVDDKTTAKALTKENEPTSITSNNADLEGMNVNVPAGAFSTQQIVGIALATTTVNGKASHSLMVEAHCSGPSSPAQEQHATIERI